MSRKKKVFILIGILVASFIVGFYLKLVIDGSTKVSNYELKNDLIGINFEFQEEVQNIIVDDEKDKEITEDVEISKNDQKQIEKVEVSKEQEINKTEKLVSTNSNNIMTNIEKQESIEQTEEKSIQLEQIERNKVEFTDKEEMKKEFTEETPIHQESNIEQSQTSYWCVEGGTHHLAGDEENEHGYYQTWEEAFKAYEDYTIGWDSTQFKVDHCPCGLYYFWVTR